MRFYKQEEIVYKFFDELEKINLKKINIKTAKFYFSTLYKIFDFFYTKKVDFKKIDQIISYFEFLELEKKMDFLNVEGENLLRKLRAKVLYVKINFVDKQQKKQKRK